MRLSRISTRMSWNMVARFAGPLAAAEIYGIGGLCLYLAVWYIVKAFVWSLVTTASWKKSVMIWKWSPIFLALAGVSGWLLDSHDWVIMIVIPSCVGIYEAMYWTPFFAIKEHPDIKEKFTDDDWQFSEILGTVLGMGSSMFLFNLGGASYAQGFGAVVAVLAILFTLRMNNMDKKPDNWKTAEKIQKHVTVWTREMKVAATMAALFSLTQAFSINWLRVVTFTGEISLKTGVLYFSIAVVAAEVVGWILSGVWRNSGKNPSRKVCLETQRGCGAIERFSFLEQMKRFFGFQVPKPKFKVHGTYRGGLKCQNPDCDRDWDAEIRTQWRMPLCFVIAGCTLILVSGTALISVFVGYLMVIGAKAGVLRRVEAADTRHFLTNDMKGRGGREWFRFSANLVVPPTIFLLSANGLLAICIACSIALLRLSVCEERPYKPED
jgi:hypothetical protein